MKHIMFIHRQIEWNATNPKYVTLQFKFFSLQDSCNEANTPDHTIETETQALVVTETPSAKSDNDNDNSVDMLADLFEKLYHLNKKLEEQEDDIFR